MKKLLPLLTLAALAVGGHPSTADEISDLRKSWRDCVDASALFFAVKTTEAADIVAQGAFGACEPQIYRYMSTLFSKTKSSDIDELNRLVKANELDARNGVIAVVLKARAEK